MFTLNCPNWTYMPYILLGVGRRTESSNTNGLCPLFEEYFGIRIIGIALIALAWF